MKYDISTFVDELIEAKGLSGLNDEVVAQMKKDLTVRIENRIHAIIATNIPEESREEFDKLIDSTVSDEEVSKFCAEKIPNLQDLVAADLVQFKNVYIGS